MRIFKFLVIVTLFCLPCSGQAVRYDSVAQTTAAPGNNQVVALPGAVITVCIFPATVAVGSACTNKANICTDITASSCTTSGNPLTADSQGNFGFWALPCAGSGSCYDYTICPAGGGACGGASQSAGVTHVTLGPVLASGPSTNTLIWSGVHRFTGGYTSIYNALGSINIQLGTTAYQLRLGIDSTDTGLFLVSDSVNGAVMAGGAAFNGTNWVAKATSAGIFSSRAAQIDLFQDTGLTIGNNFTPTSRFQITSGGLPTFPLGTFDMTAAGNCTSLSAANHAKFCWDNATQSVKVSQNAGAYAVLSTASTNNYDFIQQNGAALTQRSILNFSGSVTCTDNAGSTRTDCNVAPDYQTIQQAGTPLTQRSTLNFLGAGVTCVDNAGSVRTDCTVTNAGAVPDPSLSSNVAFHDEVAGGHASQTVTWGNISSPGSFNWTLKAGDGGAFILKTSDAIAGNSTAASIQINPGNSHGNFSGAQLSITGGNASGTGVQNGGTLSLTGGNASGTGTGGAVFVLGGIGSTSVGGPIIAQAGAGFAAAGGTLTAKGGTGGNGFAGGAVTVGGGIGGGAGGGDGGPTTIKGGDGSSGVSNGGDINITAGVPFGGGVHGRIVVNGISTTPATCSAGNACTQVQSSDGRFRDQSSNDARGAFFRDGQTTYTGQCVGTLTASQTIFLFGMGTQTLTTCTVTSAPVVGAMVASAGILRNLVCKAGSAGTNASSGAVTVNKNGAGSTLTCTIGTGTTCSDTTHTVAVAQGDTLTIQATSQILETLANVSCAVEKN